MMADWADQYMKVVVPSTGQIIDCLSSGRSGYIIQGSPPASFFERPEPSA